MPRQDGLLERQTPLHIVRIFKKLEVKSCILMLFKNQTLHVLLVVACSMYKTHQAARTVASCGQNTKKPQRQYYLQKNKQVKHPNHGAILYDQLYKHKK